MRSKKVAFIGKIGYIAKSLICLIPKDPLNVDLEAVVAYLDSPQFRANYTYSGRFIIGQQQLASAVLTTPKTSTE